jgi:uncharacterized membrane protein
MDIDSSAEIGYGKPPKRSRFQKGVSGNPKGRPKGKRNFATVLAEALEEEIVINENGVPKTVTKLEAAVKQLVNKATFGDLIAARQLIALVRSAEERAVESPRKQLSEDDLKIMERVLHRQGNCKTGEADGDE